jgi:exopolyphosphatase/pppGpp-phosphohydrolase
MSKQLLLDIGSSSVKVYLYEDNKLTLLETNSFKFREGYNEETGISEEKKESLISYLEELQKRFEGATIKTYATAVFRKLPEYYREKLIQDILNRTRINFNIISHELENHYLEKALIDNYNTSENILLINIGGGSTELVVIKNNAKIFSSNIEIGIGPILAKFAGINNQLSDTGIDEVINYVKTLLPEMPEELISKVAFYNGGELNYMQLTGYNLVENNLFNDESHPSIISSSDFAKQNRKVFEEITLEELESKMPRDPKWMHGARACSSIAQAICEKYQVKTIIPSNSNLIDGVVRSELV